MGTDFCCVTDPSEYNIKPFKHKHIAIFDSLTEGTPTSTVTSLPTEQSTNISPSTSSDIAPLSKQPSSISNPVAILPDTMSNPLEFIAEDEELTDSICTHHTRDSSTFNDIDQNIRAPIDLFNYFSDESMSTTSPNISIFKSISEETSISIDWRGMSRDKSDWSIQRYITLRRKESTESIVLDLVKFGLFLKAQHINTEHIWYNTLWSKYDKLFTLKIDFFCINELLKDLLNEYLSTEYGNKHNIDLMDVAQQIIIHIWPYHMAQHSTINLEMTDDDDMNIPFTFNDFCSLGDWLLEIQEIEQESFIMDYWDMVQYVDSNKEYIWKHVIINKLIINQIDINQISKAMELVLINYGRNRLGNNINMKLYSSQIKQCTEEIIKLFNQWNQTQNNVITKKQFFQFIACIPSISL